MASERGVVIPEDRRARVMYEVMPAFAREHGFDPTVFDVGRIVAALEQMDDEFIFQQTFGPGSDHSEFMSFHLVVLPFKGPIRRRSHPVIIHGLPRVGEGERTDWVRERDMTMWITNKARELLGSELTYWVPGNFQGEDGRQLSGDELLLLRMREQKTAEG